MNPLMTLPIRTILSAYANISGDTGSISKQAAADWLLQRGIQRPDVIRAAGGAPQPAPQPAPSAVNVTAPRVDAIEAKADRLADSVEALKAQAIAHRDRIQAMSGTVQAIEQAATAQAHTLGTINQRLDALGQNMADRLDRIETATPKAAAIDPAAAHAAIVDEVRRAWGPFEAAVSAAGAAAQVQQAAAAKVTATRTALEVFGLEVKDRKGDPLMFDVYDDPTAPAIDPDHLWSEKMVRAVYRAARHGARGNVWLGGLKGAGKTMTLQQFAARTGRAFCRINFHQHTSSDEYLGATGLAGGVTQFQAADFLMAFTRPGAVVCLDEITNAHPGSLAPLNGLLEPGARISLGGQLWSRAPGVVIGACDNTTGSGDATGRYSGTREMNSALMDRFAFKEWCEFLPRDLERKALMSRTGASAKLVDHVLDAIDACRAKVQTGEIIDPPSIRAVEGFLLALQTEQVREAWAMTIAAAQPAESAVGLEAVYTACINPGQINRMI